MAKKADCTSRKICKGPKDCSGFVCSETTKGEVGFSNGGVRKEAVAHFPEPILCNIDGLLLLHSLLFVPDCPIHLMVRDLLTKLGATYFF